ncbi:hypothetical protein SAMN05216251_12766 [Actinacidiphila alni]|uniref:PPM-type phosphatase domain-containing protein n=1 Tax=Actinacidiphila alni TaxID=380248 RepID=A0A1I2LDY6_9ACTN|nr:hypothetical protein SAMN05216251_12766 [Actinacidiphila alni]
MTEYVKIGTAQRPGTEPPCADGHDVQRTHGTVSAAVVDGAGHRPATVRYAGIAPAVITHIGNTLGGVPALMTAGQMARAYDEPPHLSAVYARIGPDSPTVLVWIGDCRAYGWSAAGGLTLWTTDQTMGEYLRTRIGAPLPRIPEAYDDFVRLGLTEASAATCMQAQIPAAVRLIVLCSDGVSDQVKPEVWSRLCAEHGGNPPTLADALVAAACANAAGYRDDATVAVLLRCDG